MSRTSERHRAPRTNPALAGPLLDHHLESLETTAASLRPS